MGALTFRSAVLVPDVARRDDVERSSTELFSGNLAIGYGRWGAPAVGDERRTWA